MKESDNFSEDVKYWAEYKTGIREFKPWLESAEGKSTGGLAKPQTLDEANGMYAKVKEFEEQCSKHLKVHIVILKHAIISFFLQLLHFYCNYCNYYCILIAIIPFRYSILYLFL